MNVPDRSTQDVALAVIHQAYVDHFVGLDGHTPAGHRFPGAWLNRRPKTRARAAELRSDADWFLFSPDPEAVALRNFWFRDAGWYGAPTRREIEFAMARTIERRHPKEPFCL